jgi:hypothetical protein
MGDDHLLRYHKSILEPYPAAFPDYAKLNFCHFHQNGADLGVTRLRWESSIGIAIIPGIIVPRECYERILALQ